MKTGPQDSAAISWDTGDSRFGPIVVGATEQGVCCVLFVEGGDPEAILAAEFPSGELTHNADASGHLRDVLAALNGESAADRTDLDLIGTSFQRDVWSELQRIAAGETASYSQVASRIGRPAAVRAVAGACSANHAAVLVPCHRVVRTDGGLGGYRWGTELKRAILDAEIGEDTGHKADAHHKG